MLIASAVLALKLIGCCFFPQHATVRVQMHAEPAADNRAFVLVIDDGANFFRSSTFQLEGEYAPATMSQDYRNIPEGHYTVTLMLVNDRGEAKKTITQDITVGTPD